MSNSTYTAKETSFWNFIKENEIEIPIIQRDYAQGRLGKESLRKNFLSDLKKALDNEKPYNDKAMKMDFVYGSVEHEKMNPLDGQQRLTTLWLLHWYVALRAEKLVDEVAKILNRFSYETRISSREFCGNLCNPDHFKGFDGNDIVGFITRQTWFYSAWKQDPTIQAMLRMLGGTKVTDKKGEDIVDGIEELFACPQKCEIKEGEKCIVYRKFNEYWCKLTGDNCPIVFYHLPLRDFGLSDDLYIKMNARGKQLTSFENFKADLVDYITEHSDSELLDEDAKKRWKALLEEREGIPIKMDTTWTDIFWRNKSVDSKIDEIYFAFLNRFFWDKLFMYKNKDGKYVLDIGKGAETSTQENNNPSYKYLNNSNASLNVYDTTISYKELDMYKFLGGEIPYDVLKDLQIVLNRYKEIPVCTWEDSFRFIPAYEINNENNVEITDTSGEKILKVTYLNQVQRIVFHAVCKYFIEGEADETTIKQWMRVVWNLVSGEDAKGPQIRSTSAMRSAMEFIDKLNSHNVYSCLAHFTEKLSDSEFDRRCKEEIAKAKQILDENGNIRKYKGELKKEDGTSYETWEEIIKYAEIYAFFKGAIRFLFQNTEGNVTEESWEQFDTKWRNTKEYFGGENPEGTIELAKYCNDSQIKEIWNRYSFSDKYWKPILLEKSITEPIHRFLMKEDCNNDSVLYKDINNLLPKTGTAVWLLSDWLCCKVVLTNYSQKRSEPYNGWVFEVGNDIRNQFNKIIVNVDNSEIIILPPPASGEEKQICNGQVYYRGLWTDIEYQGHYYFRYHGNNTICLMDKENKNNKKLKDPNKPDALGNYYYAAIDKNENKETFLSKLNDLVKEASQNEQ